MILSLETSLEVQQHRITDLEIMLQNMQRMLFGKKCEKMVPQVPAAVGEQISLLPKPKSSAPARRCGIIAANP